MCPFHPSLPFLRLRDKGCLIDLVWALWSAALVVVMAGVIVTNSCSSSGSGCSMASLLCLCLFWTMSLECRGFYPSPRWVKALPFLVLIGVLMVVCHLSFLFFLSERGSASMLVVYSAYAKVPLCLLSCLLFLCLSELTPSVGALTRCYSCPWISSFCDSLPNSLNLPPTLLGLGLLSKDPKERSN